jgi:hypothetical protein
VVFFDYGAKTRLYTKKAVDVLLWFTGLMPLRGLQLLVFPALLLAYLLALCAKDGRSLIAWPLYLCKSVALGLFIQTTGGAAGPLHIDAAIGHVTRKPGETLDALLQRADKRMYEAKHRYYLKIAVA